MTFRSARGDTVFYYLTSCDTECFYADPLLVSSFFFAVLLETLYAKKEKQESYFEIFIESSKNGNTVSKLTVCYFQ